jgi:hypothetical protein
MAFEYSFGLKQRHYRRQPVICFTRKSKHAYPSNFNPYRADYLGVLLIVPVTVVERCKSSIVFARSNTGIVGSNPTQGMDVCVRLFCVCAVLYAGSGLAAS